MFKVNSTHGRREDSHKILIRMPEEKRSLQRARYRWETNVIIDMKS